MGRRNTLTCGYESKFSEDQEITAITPEYDYHTWHKGMILEAWVAVFGTCTASPVSSFLCSSLRLRVSVCWVGDGGVWLEEAERVGSQRWGILQRSCCISSTNLLMLSVYHNDAECSDHTPCAQYYLLLQKFKCFNHA